MIIIKIVGGLASQLHKYAIGRALSIKHKTELKLDITWYDNIPDSDTVREFHLLKYNLKAGIASKEEVDKYKPNWLLVKIKNKIYQYFNIDLKFNCYTNKSFMPIEEFNMLPKEIYLEGEWSGYHYFKDIKKNLLNEFTIDTNILTDRYFNYLNKIQNTNSVSLHVRRGDYVRNEHASQLHVVSEINYYQNAIKYLENKLHDNFVLFIFSDDLQWTKKNLLLKRNIEKYYIEGIIDNEEFELLRRCKHNIISNSGFSWLSAWLNTNTDKIVISPKKWMFDNKLNNQFLDSIQDKYTIFMDNVK